MKKLLTYSIVLLAPIFFCNSCNREGLSNQEKEIQPIVGSNDFFVSLSYIKKIDSKSGEAEPEAILDFIQPLFEPAIHYLSLNGYDYTTDFEDGDPTIILTALGVLEVDLAMRVPTRALGAFDIIGCVLIGDSLQDLAGTGAMLIAKRIASRLLERAIPYIGAAVMVGSAAACIYEQWD